MVFEQERSYYRQAYPQTLARVLHMLIIMIWEESALRNVNCNGHQRRPALETGDIL